MSSVGKELRRWRTMRGLTLRQLGAGVNYSYAYLAEIEIGRKLPLPKVIKACDDYLGADGQLIALAQEADEVKRRDFVRNGVALAAVPMLPGAQSDWRGALSGLSEQLWRLFATTSDKGALLPLVHAQLALVEDDWLRGSLLQLAGEIHFDANRYSAAASCYADAAKAGESAKDHDLWACALTRHAFIGVYDRRFAEALPLLENAENIAAQGDRALSTEQWVQMLKAQVFAGLGQRGECERALTRARAADGKSHNGGWLRFDGSRVAEETGTCYVELGHPDLAEAALREAFTQPLSPRRQGLVLTDLAMIGVLRRDRDQVSCYATQALDIARQTGSGAITRKLTNLQSRVLEGL